MLELDPKRCAFQNALLNYMHVICAPPTEKTPALVSADCRKLVPLHNPTLPPPDLIVVHVGAGCQQQPKPHQDSQQMRTMHACGSFSYKSSGASHTDFLPTLSILTHAFQ